MQLGRRPVPKPHPTLMTIGEVAARVRHLAVDPFALTERCRHWAKLGLLVSADPHTEGTGKHKLYDQRAIYDAALLTALADAGVEPGRVVEADFKPSRRLQITEEMRWLLDAQYWAKQALIQWKQERARGQNEPLYLEVFLIPPGKHYVDIHRGTPMPPEEIAKRSRLDDPTKARAAFSIRFDLGMLFESVSKPAKPKEAEATKRARAKVA
jgi:DNA-binding transcriptional MerR regulator